MLNVKDRLARLQGVGEVGLFGSGDYAMRVWLDPQKLSFYSITTTEVIDTAGLTFIGPPPVMMNALVNS